MGSPILFIILAIIVLGSAVAMITSQNSVHSALFMILNFSTVAVFYIVLNAPFIAMVQIAVYAGAIMVLFLFVIMLLGGEKLAGESAPDWQRPIAVLCAGFLVLLLAYTTMRPSAMLDAAAAAPIDASPEAIGLTLFGSYVFPFEITSILLLTAMIGVVVLRVPKKGGK